MGLIALIAFWVLAVKLWITDGAKIPLICMLLWFLGFFGIPILNLPGYFFVALQSALAVFLLLVERYKAAF